jgi:hypothetical protein
MRASPRLEDARDETPQKAAQEAGCQRQEHVQRERGNGHRADDGGKETAHEELAVGADVEQAGPEAKRHRQAGEDQRCRRVQG